MLYRALGRQSLDDLRHRRADAVCDAGPIRWPGWPRPRCFGSKHGWACYSRLLALVALRSQRARVRRREDAGRRDRSGTAAQRAGARTDDEQRSRRHDMARFGMLHGLRPRCFLVACVVRTRAAVETQSAGRMMRGLSLCAR